MRTVVLYPYAYTPPDHTPSVVIRYRVCVSGRFAKTGFWIFPLPAHAEHMFQRAYTELDADMVHWQDSLTVTHEKGWFD